MNDRDKEYAWNPADDEDTQRVARRDGVPVEQLREMAANFLGYKVTWGKEQ